MALDQEVHNSPSSPQLGCWWRLWIAFSVFTTTAMLIVATYEEAWERLGVLTVLLLIGYSAATLVLGMTFAWIRKGKRS